MVIIFSSAQLVCFNKFCCLLCI